MALFIQLCGVKWRMHGLHSSPTFDFWVADAAKYRWGLPVLVKPTCPKKMFMQGPRLKYY